MSETQVPITFISCPVTEFHFTPAVSEATKPLSIVMSSCVSIRVTLLLKLDLKLIISIRLEKWQPKLVVRTKCLMLIGDKEMSGPFPDLVPPLNIFDSRLHGFNDGL